MSKDHLFKKGQSGNPNGRPKLSLDARAFKLMSYHTFIEHLQRYGAMSREEMAAELKRPDATMFELMFGNIVASAARGDKDARQLLIDRLWGKVKEDMDFTIYNQKVQLENMSMQELMVLVRDHLPQEAS